MRVAERPGLLRSLAAILAHSGDSWFLLLGLVIVWFVGTDVLQSIAVMMAVGIIVTAIVVMLIKFTVRRRRPEGEWGNIYRRTDPHSFPSGHAARAAMLAVMAFGLGPGWLGVLFVFWAGAVILARVAMGVHFLSDVLAGALLGVLMGFILLQLPFGSLTPA
jgi:undecaprenyl-diphosphatase